MKMWSQAEATRYGAAIGRGQFGIHRLARLADPRDRRADFVDLAAAEFEVFDAEPDGTHVLVGLGVVEPLDQLAQRGLDVAEQALVARAFRIFAVQGEADDGRCGLGCRLGGRTGLRRLFGSLLTCLDRRFGRLLAVVSAALTGFDSTKSLSSDSPSFSCRSAFRHRLLVRRLLLARLGGLGLLRRLWRPCRRRRPVHGRSEPKKTGKLQLQSTRPDRHTMIPRHVHFLGWVFLQPQAA